MVDDMIKKFCAAGILAASFLFLVSPEALAEGGRRGGGVIRLEEITIEGRVQKPNAFYVLQRSSLGFEQAQTEQSFVDEVIDSVNREPF
jgi:hypothetical protein